MTRTRTRRRRPQVKGMNPQGGMKRRWTREGEMRINKLRAMYPDMDEDE